MKKGSSNQDKTPIYWKEVELGFRRNNLTSRSPYARRALEKRAESSDETDEELDDDDDPEKEDSKFDKFIDIGDDSDDQDFWDVECINRTYDENFKVSDSMAKINWLRLITF